MIGSLVDVALVVLKLLMFNVCAIIDISKIDIKVFSVLKRLSKKKEN